MREYFTTKLGSFLQLKVQAGVGELLDETHSRLQLPKSRSTILPPSAESGGKRDWEKSKLASVRKSQRLTTIGQPEDFSWFNQDTRHFKLTHYRPLRNRLTCW